MNSKLIDVLLRVAVVMAFIAVIIVAIFTMGNFSPSVGDQLGGWEKCGLFEDSNTKPYWACDYELQPIFKVIHVEPPTGSSLHSVDCSVYVERFDYGTNYHWLACDIGFGGPDWKVAEQYDGLVIWLLSNGIKISF